LFELSLSFLAGFMCRDDPGVVELAGEWKAQMAVEDDGLGGTAVDQAYRQTRIVGQDSADADEDGLVVGAQLVGEAHRFRATDGQRLAALFGDGAV
jgi:hypothetical protein